VRLVCVIPARFASTRLPGKPLRLLGGEPLIRRVVRRVLAFGLDARIVVASDDPRVLDAARPLGVGTVLTNATHGSGTERVAEVLATPGYADVDVVLNLQGDEPFLPAAAAHGAVTRVLAGDDIGTAAQPLAPGADRDPHRVKVVVDGRGRALRFYRTPVAVACQRGEAVFQHMGVYAYRPDALARWMALPAIDDERRAALEQLRPLRHGMHIGVALLGEAAPHGIDTEEDLRLAEGLL